MLRYLLVFLGLTTAAAFAASPDLRAVAIAQLRSIAEPLFEHGASTEPRFDAFYADMVESLPAQEKVERALELAINRRVGAAEYVMTNAQGWRGHFESTPKLRSLINIAGDAPLIETRMAGFEIYLAQYGLEKSPAEVDRMLAMAAADPEKSSAWALWNIGVLGARGVDRERVFGELLAAMGGQDMAQHHAALEGLALFGGTEIIEPLLQVAAQEPDPMLRERAFCALAQSGTLLMAERYEAVPGLLAIADDAHSDKRTIAWAFQALREISDIHGLPDDASQWRARLSQAGLL